MSFPVKAVIEPPRDVIKSPLSTHQTEGLQWLLSRENSSDLPLFWEEDDGEFVHTLTSSRTVKRPEPLRGGILADDAGMGKTLTLLSLISLDRRQDFQKDVINATLLLCPRPASHVFWKWTHNYLQHVVPGSLRLLLYCDETPGSFKPNRHDLVFTTPDVLAKEDEEAPIRKLEWRRIILAEAHHFKHDNDRETQAVIRLKAKRRWAVTGMPVQNSSMDLFSLMAFLHFEPFSVEGYWHSLVQRPLDLRMESGLTRLKILMDAISLRRTKEKALAPPTTIETYFVELASGERELYNWVNGLSKNYISSCMSDQIEPRQLSTMRSMILQLRQVCVDMALCPQINGLYFASEKNIRDISEEPELLMDMVERLKSSTIVELGCGICMSPPSEAMVFTLCAHIFCRPCIMQALECPICHRTLKESDLFATPFTYIRLDRLSSSPITMASSKTSALIKHLQENPPVKSIIFTQLLEMASLLESHLKVAGFKTLLLDGTMDVFPTKEIREFQSGQEPIVLLASLTASSTGINLNTASRVYFMDPCWNPADEERAMDCFHRLGQKEAVKIVRLIAINSIEERILELLDMKKQPAQTPSEDVDMDIADVRFLMNI